MAISDNMNVSDTGALPSESGRIGTNKGTCVDAQHGRLLHSEHAAVLRLTAAVTW